MSPIAYALLGFIALMLLVLIAQNVGIRARLMKLEGQSGQNPASSNSQKSSSVDAEGSASEGDSPFEEFLAEDPQRLALGKSEQFAAYRRWRKDKGMNWSDPAS